MMKVSRVKRVTAKYLLAVDVQPGGDAGVDEVRGALDDVLAVFSTELGEDGVYMR